MPGGFHRADLVPVDMGGVGRHHALPGAQEGGDGSKVGLGAADEELDLGLGTLAEIPDEGLGPVTVSVVTIAHVSLQAGLGQSGEDLWVGAEGVVVAEEILHFVSLHCSGGGGAPDGVPAAAP